MLLLNKNLYSVLFIFLFSGLTAQECKLVIEGRVIDVHDDEPLAYANVYIKDVDRGVVSDQNGKYKITGLCPGDFHLVVSHIACEPVELFIRLASDTTLTIVMDHGHTLEDVVIEDERDPSLDISQTISRQNIQDQSNKDLATILEGLTGVSVMRNGGAIAKPVVQGLTGNRLSIINNGIPQSGQQWGNDHSPEIDPLNSGSIRVVKGVGTIEHQASNLGALVVVEPEQIKNEPHLHGRVISFLESNGRGAGLNFRMRKFSNFLAWGLSGTIKKSGDRHAPDYFLNNTGNEELNLALQLEKAISDSSFLKIYLSTFNAELGVLRGSHISNLTNLQMAFAKDEPFFTEEEFSYGIEAPRQTVSHHLAKLNWKHFFVRGSSIDFTTAFQLNDRKEFDIRRGGRSKIPALSIEQYTFFTGLKYAKRIGKHNIKTGAQFTVTDNNNDFTTGILPLIPNYLQTEIGAFILTEKKSDNWTYGLGLRYDFLYQDVLAVSSDLPRRFVDFKNPYHKLAASINLSREYLEKLKVEVNAGFVQRNPGINELYSGGLHQGVSGIEEGDTTLTMENAFKFALRNQWEISERTSLEALVFANFIENFIHLNSTGEIRLTIRGSFPVFNYAQNNATMTGFELRAKHALNESIHISGNYSYLKARNLDLNRPFQFIPANALNGALTYRFHSRSKSDKRGLENPEINFNYRYVFRQDTDLNEFDFQDVPDPYALLGMKISGELQSRKKRWRFVLKVENLLNTRYRDYLNRLRYFSDDLGRNVSLSVRLSF